MNDLQRDIERIDAIAAMMFEGDREAWQRLKPRLTPDRERVARAIEATAAEADLDENVWLAQADAAIKAMGEGP